MYFNMSRTNLGEKLKCIPYHDDGKIQHIPCAS